jgi:hypothetical protein
LLIAMALSAVGTLAGFGGGEVLLLLSQAAFLIRDERQAVLAEQELLVLPQLLFFLFLDRAAGHPDVHGARDGSLDPKSRTAARDKNQNGLVGEAAVDLVPGLVLFHKLAGAVRDDRKAGRGAPDVDPPFEFSRESGPHAQCACQQPNADETHGSPPVKWV